MINITQCIQNENKNVTVEETIYAIKNAGYKSVFVQWYDKNWEFSQQQQVDLCKKLGFEIEFLHLGYENINDIWLDTKNGDELVEKYLKNLDDCKLNNIPMVIMHLTRYFETPKPSIVGINRLQKLADYAKKLNIKIAFENTRKTGYLEFVFEHIKNYNIGICFDLGHYHCYFNDQFNWELFKNRIIAVHIHDNDKSDDQHLLPFDGTLDWNEIILNLKNANYKGSITLESCYRNQYLNYSVDEFYKKSYELGEKLREMIM